ncbi:MAG: hypothetical protein JO227_23515 [Acetobacteraceae bacterium]|nr:hypothetical protein [Acetobacteraceae bacterium]
MSVLRGFAFAITAALAACAKPPPPPAPSPAPVVQAPSSDGVYRGTSTRFQAENRACPHPGLVMLAVQNNQFSFHWTHETYVDSVIGSDGEVHGYALGITLIGKYDGQKIEGDVTNGTCSLHFRAMHRES